MKNGTSKLPRKKNLQTKTMKTGHRLNPGGEKSWKGKEVVQLL